MKKAIFLVGKLYDLSTKTANEIERDVQSRLDAHYGSNYILFRINVCKQSKGVTINFRRNYNEWYHPENRTNIFCADMDLITGRGIEGFAVPCMWPIAPFGYPFSTGIDEFITCYKESAKEFVEQLIPGFDVSEIVEYAYNHNIFGCERRRFRRK